MLYLWLLSEERRFCEQLKECRWEGKQTHTHTMLAENRDPLKAFEDDMNSLIQSIQHYSPDPALSSAVIQDCDRIGTQIRELQTLKDGYMSYDMSQQEYDVELSNGYREILSTLVECKRNLDQLPKERPESQAGAKKHGAADPEDTKTILSYALKLSKFTKIPRTFDGFLLPNNFIWPGDDNMRRGTLALTSLMPEKIVQRENYGEEAMPEGGDSLQSNGNTEEQEAAGKERPETHEDDKGNDSEDDFIPERSNSIAETSRPESSSVMAGLDLLDSDDE